MGSRIRVLLPFLPYAAISVVHVAALFAGHTDAGNAVAGPSKLALMPALALAVVWAAGAREPEAPPGSRTVLRGAGGPIALLVAAILCSWLGDGAATFFPMFDDELPMMLLCFGLAHIAYLVLLWRTRGLAVHRAPMWAAVYALAYAVLIVLLIPRAGALTVPVMAYGLLLAGTAAMASRCTAAIAWGGAWFFASDAILSLRIFMPEVMPAWTSGVVMLTYTLGQGLISYGVVASLWRREAGPRLLSPQPEGPREAV
ncbi:lysoplasmalogenase [Leucobacter tenebrionis]|uniref:lysoplasmalogenase n=1 Tax=Leucobacter tenebrionis TaxID=2873270 RepID=UPI001CA63EEE|nr:lysoplasmalogenase [Leucobacter tenebrionis]QZY51269.1 lysoplasmalogenase [Leucobacter tenebrionis]